jgi:hypothetical protein
MRSSVIKTLLTFAFFGAIAAVAETDLRVQLPFNFVAKGHTLPAGYYELIVDSGFVTMVNQNDPSKIIKEVLLSTDPAKDYFNLKFQICDDAYHLRSIQAGRRITENLDLPRSQGATRCASPTR